MKQFLNLFIGLFAVTAVAQLNVVQIDAYVLDGQTQQPIEFANLNVLNRDLGTVTASDGTFHLEFIEDQIGTQDQLKISALGYAPKVISIKTLYGLMEKNNILYLNPFNETISKETVKNKSKQASGNTISGRVVSENGPIQGASVVLNGTYNEARTDANGNFTINAPEGALLKVSYLTTYPKQIKAAQNMEVSLTTDGELLEQVELKSDKKVFLSDRKIETAYGKKNFDRLGYRAAQITYDEISAGALTFEQALLRLPTVGVVNPTSINLNNGRAIVVDDMVYSGGEQGFQNLNNQIDMNNVYSITVIPGIVGSVRYGTLGRNGVIIVRTKAYAAAQGDYKPEGEKEKALVEGNNYSEQVPMLTKVMSSPDYLMELKQAGNFEKAKLVYKSQLDQGRDKSIAYYVNASEYFEKWDKDFSAHVAMNILEVAPKNTKALKTLAYRLESLGDLENAKSVYQRIAILAPDQAQSYRDLAYIYKETGEYTKSFALYKRILANQTPNVDFSGLKAVAEAEIRHIIANHKSKVYYKDLPNELLQVNYKKDVRIVFEWNDPQAEFDLQFVNPNGKYYTYKHTKFDNLETMEAEMQAGYAIQEFTMDDSPSGQWLINAASVNNPDGNNPTYLKYTIYKNYGKSNETQETHLVNLSAQKEKVTLAKVNY